MTTFFISRHSGAVDWANQNGFEGVEVISHATPDFFNSLKEGDKVVGILPVSLAFEVCAKGAEFWDLSLPNLPAEWRSKELTADQMNQCGAKLTRFMVTKL